ncbi:unnamed protein product [Lota lota]
MRPNTVIISPASSDTVRSDPTIVKLFKLWVAIVQQGRRVQAGDRILQHRFAPSTMPSVMRTVHVVILRHQSSWSPPNALIPPNVLLLPFSGAISFS